VSSYELVSYERSDRGDYVGLLGEAGGHQGLSGEEFDWWFDRNPAGSLMSVARANGRVVGVAAHTLLPMVLGGEERTASFSVHATTHPSMRGQGIFARLEEKHEREAAERGVAVVLAFASAPTAPIFLGPLGWTEIGRLRIWVRPVLGRSGEPPAAGVDVEGDAAASWPNHVIRDTGHLAWRYLDSPRGYVALRSANGYAVVWPAKPHRGRTIAVLADLAAPRGEVPELLRRATRASRARLLFALPAPEQRRTFLAVGFLPTHLTLHFIGKALAENLDTDLHAWRFTLGDTDFF
jgi:GNAT superfamily N-acetyltransferase